jgi:glutaconate CoA-transferase, subunit A
MSRDKRMTEEEAVASIRSGMTIGIGGWGSRRKPMSLVRALCRSDVTDLTVVSYGGPDVGLLCATGKVKELIYGFVSLDSIPLEPFFRKARQTGAVSVRSWDEGMLYQGLQAASRNLPFLPTAVGIGTVTEHDPALKTVTCPYTGRKLLAVPALNLDVALIHMNRADKAGNGQFLGPDLYFDDLFARAADQVFMSCEQVIETSDLLREGSVHTLRIPRMAVTGVIEAPMGAHFTTCEPDYGRDEAFQKQYAVAAKDPEAWLAFAARFVNVDHATYQREVAS